MFGSKVDDAANDKIVTLISSDVTIEGSVLATHAIRVDGIVNGAVRTKESVIVGSKAVVRGGIKASNLMSAGDVYGDIECPKGKVEISDTGRVFGDITAERLVIDENAVFQGKCTMTGKGAKPAGEAVVVPENLGAETKDADSRETETADSNASDAAEEKTEVLSTEDKPEETPVDSTDGENKTEEKTDSTDGENKTEEKSENSDGGDKEEKSDSEEKKDDDKTEDSEKTEVLSDSDKNKDSDKGKEGKKKLFGKH